MPRAFPQHFDLRLFDGPRAKQFTKPEDAFQQLIGDALKEMTGPYANISPTLGTDGSIDAYLEGSARLTGPFSDLPLPLIVECKAHDDGAKNPRKNIFDQWGKVRRKIEAAADAGWQDLFQPWFRARGYVYCISAILQNKKNRDDLDAAIRKLFTDLSISKQTLIESIRVVDWSDLRQWLGTLPVVSDEWLGIELDLILSHQRYLQRLTGFREFLLPSKLAFVPPPKDSPFHPVRILQELEEQDENHGVLVVGAGGVGKTRTAMEVGTLAANRGWRVLHVLPDEPGVETEDIAKVVLHYCDSRTLLVFDYIDQMQKLDLGSIRRSLIPEAQERGITLRLLANCRPGWLEPANHIRDEMFRLIDLRPSERHRSRLIETMADAIASTACRMIGRNEVIRLCGSRAIIALLIARELESRAASDLLIDLNITNFRSGDLVQWLRRRLQENNLTVRHDVVSLDLPRPDVPMVAAAATLACAPETRENLVAAAQATYEHLHQPAASENAQYLLGLLVKLGWLEAHGMFDSTAHDVVADEVLDQTIHTDAIVFETELTAVLSCSLSIPRGIGRLATALRRVLGSLKNEDAVPSLNDSLERWLHANASALGEVLQTGDPDLTGYALGALLSGPPWEESAIQEWNQVFLPWLNAYGTKEEARHLLYKGLKSVRGNQAALIAPALAWLSVHRLAVLATFVIKPLLDRADLLAEDAERARRFALNWLDQHLDTLEAQFVLYSLLRRGDLSSEDAEQAGRFALNWLDQHHDTLEARFVLNSLLERGDLSNEDAEQAGRFAFSWLEKHHDTLEARFVLDSLLERGDLSSEDAERGRRFALNWLGQYNDTLEARFVLDSLLKRGDLSSENAKRARRFALNWLGQYNDTLEAGFVLNSLLERGDLSSEDAEQAGRFALNWLEQHHNTLEAGFVLNSLLERGDLSSEDAEQARRFALSWLDQHHDTLDAGFVLDSLLERSDLSSEDAEQAGRFAFSWLEKHHDTLGAGFVLNSLLERSDLSSEDAEQAGRFALSWLDQHHNTLEAGFVLDSLLERGDLSSEDAEQARRFALNWLGQYHDTLEARFVLNSLLERGDLSSEDAERAGRFALNWLDQHHNTLEARFVLDSLLKRGDLSSEDAEQARRFALSWLEKHHLTLHAGFVLPPLLNQRVIEGDDALSLVQSAVAWLQVFYETTDAEFVIKKLFRRGDVPREAQSSLLSAAIKRLRQMLSEDEATFLLRSCLQYRVNDEKLQRELVLLAIEWLELHPNSPVGDYVWNRVLRYPPILVSDGDWLSVAAHALRWLRDKTVRDKGVDQTTNSLLRRPLLLEAAERESVIHLSLQLMRMNIPEQGRRRLIASLERMLESMSDEDPLKLQIEIALGCTIEPEKLH